MNEQHTNISNILAKRARQVQRGGARAAVLGINDGLVSTLCLVIGMAAAGASNHIILIAGFAGLLAGAISMAAGEWISVQSQVELFEGVIRDSQEAMMSDPSSLKHQLAHKLAHLGMVHETAHAVVEDVAQDETNFLALYDAQVIGVNKDELGSPWQAAFLSFGLFTVGSLVPLSVWLFLGGRMAVGISLLATSLSGLLIGSYIATVSGKPVVYGSVRQLLIILGSAAVTYGIGMIFGVAIH